MSTREPIDVAPPTEPPAPPPAALPSPRPLSGIRRALPELLLESALIVVSVLLGFTLNQYGERRRDAALAATALASIRREIEGNLAELERIRPAHEQFLHSLGGWEAAHPANETAGQAVRRMIPEPGLQINSLDDVAWETATATDALRLMDYQTVSLLSRTYRIQRESRGSTVALFQNRFFERGSFDPKDAQSSVRLLWLITQQLVAQEESLARAYREALAELSPSR